MAVNVWVYRRYRWDRAEEGGFLGAAGSLAWGEADDVVVCGDGPEGRAGGGRVMGHGVAADGPGECACDQPHATLLPTSGTASKLPNSRNVLYAIPSIPSTPDLPASAPVASIELCAIVSAAAMSAACPSPTACLRCAIHGIPS